VQKNASNSRKHFKNIITWGTTSKYASGKGYVDEAISIAIHAMRAGIHSTLESSLGSLTFFRDLFLNLPLIADWHHAITQR
jgi:hypothetical protein